MRAEQTLPVELARAVEALGPALDRAAPLKPRRRSSLGKDIAALSKILTSERGGVPDYLRDPALQSAYLRYFLPWNVLRLGWLLSGLRLDLPENSRILDLGAGPQTFALALWAGQPDLRGQPLKIVAVDRSRPMLKAGAEIFRALAPDSPWRIVPVAAGLEETLHSEEGDFRLVVAANLLNEWASARPGDGPLETRLGKLLSRMAGKLAARGSILLVEPGTRLGGRILSAARGKAGLKALAPCLHQAQCPLPGRRDGGWCHFILPATPPAWLARLSKDAGLAKERLSLSFLHLSREAPDHPAGARIVSEAFPLPGTGLFGQYACAGQGLILLRYPKAQPLPSGGLVGYTLDQPEARDQKSGALLAVPAPLPEK